jgi:quinol monooxygenase YgiN
LTVLVLKRFGVDPSQVAAFEELAAALVDRARAAPGLLWADLSRAADDPPSFLLLCEWRTEADADAFEASADLEAFDPLLRGEITDRRFLSAH